MESGVWSQFSWYDCERSLTERLLASLTHLLLTRQSTKMPCLLVSHFVICLCRVLAFTIIDMFFLFRMFVTLRLCAPASFRALVTGFGRRKTSYNGET
jgi:hypothetical protein